MFLLIAYLFLAMPVTDHLLSSSQQLSPPLTSSDVTFSSKDSLSFLLPPSFDMLPSCSLSLCYPPFHDFAPPLYYDITPLHIHELSIDFLCISIKNPSTLNETTCHTQCLDQPPSFPACCLSTFLPPKTLYPPALVSPTFCVPKSPLLTTCPLSHPIPAITTSFSLPKYDITYSPFLLKQHHEKNVVKDTPSPTKLFSAPISPLTIDVSSLAGEVIPPMYKGANIVPSPAYSSMPALLLYPCVSIPNIEFDFYPVYINHYAKYPSHTFESVRNIAIALPPITRINYISTMQAHIVIPQPVVDATTNTIYAPNDGKPYLQQAMAGRCHPSHQLPTFDKLHVINIGNRTTIHTRISPQSNNGLYNFAIDITTTDLPTMPPNIYYIIDFNNTSAAVQDSMIKAIAKATAYSSKISNTYVIPLGSNKVIDGKISPQELSKLKTSANIYDLVLAMNLIKQKTCNGSANLAIFLSNGSMVKNWHVNKKVVAALAETFPKNLALYTITLGPYSHGMSALAKICRGNAISIDNIPSLPRKTCKLIQKLSKITATDVQVTTWENVFINQLPVPFLRNGNSISIYGQTEELKPVDIAIQGRAGPKWLSFFNTIDLMQGSVDFSINKEIEEQMALHKMMHLIENADISALRLCALEYLLAN